LSPGDGRIAIVPTLDAPPIDPKPAEGEEKPAPWETIESH
jgi:hypothetical protein